MSRDTLFVELQSQGYMPSSARQLYGTSSELAAGDVSYDGGFREATAEQMFGEESIVECYDAVPPLEPALIDGWLFQLLIIAGFVAYLYMLLRSWNFIGSIWMGVFIRRSERHMRDEGGELPLERFKISASVLGMVLLSLVVVRVVDISLPVALTSGGDIAIAPFYAMIAVVAFVAWNYLLHKLMSLVTRSEVVGGASAIALMNFVRSIVLLYPIVTAWLLSPAELLSTWSIVLCVAVALMMLIYLKETFVLFVGKKIPILHWILYLCAAILLPISFMATIIPTELV
ncbi:MAG: DUF4271 domain-containing protein [Alistipes sp.]|nr:DUF4271 domain-containing protein [Alistipes sp.]